MYRKNRMLHGITVLLKANEELERKAGLQMEEVLLLLADCQNKAVEIGTEIEARKKEYSLPIVSSLEWYCEQIFQLSQQLEVGSDSRTLISQIKESLLSIREQIKIEVENDPKKIVFFPYKASMWDSFWSIWIAAQEDNTQVSVVPIPYFEKNNDGSFGKMHDESKDFPKEVPIVSWETYSLLEECPDVVYIHNPYDDCNYVTSVHPNFYSRAIRPFTNCLVYVPYYVTSGGMNEGQRNCPAYSVVDYIVIQSKQLRVYFDETISEDKFLPFGSPKIDRLIREENSPHQLPDKWEEMKSNREVYFYNTSIGGALANTKSFLLKMEYVFAQAKENTQICLLWRPHPLLESTLSSLRPNDLPFYQDLKRRYIEENIGIYDDTADVTTSILISDGYIGDAYSSLTAMFGVTGKPLFILNPYIHSLPKEDDWKGETITGISEHNQDDSWMVTSNNQLYYTKPNQYQYTYCMDLSEYSASQFLQVRCTGEKVCICPVNAQEVILINHKKEKRVIPLEKRTDKGWIFAGAIGYEQKVLLIPANYGAIVCVDMETETVHYVTQQTEVFARKTLEGVKVGGYTIYQHYLMIGSPVDQLMYTLNLSNLKVQILKCDGVEDAGCFKLVVDSEDIWIVPRVGGILKKWNPSTGKVKEYSLFDQEISCIHPTTNAFCKEYPFGHPAVTDEALYFPPAWGNLQVKLDKKTGQIKKWELALPESKESEYYRPEVGCHFIRPLDAQKKQFLLYSYAHRSLYTVEPETGKVEKKEIGFDLEQLSLHQSGFSKGDAWLPYCAKENAFFTLGKLMKHIPVGEPFSKEKQIKEFSTIYANLDGTCGEKVHQFISSQMEGKSDD